MLMETSFRRVMTVTLLFATSVMMVLLGANRADAGANDDKAQVNSSGKEIKVKVSGSGYKGGLAGSNDSQTMTVPVPPPCWMAAVNTGKQEYDFVHSGQMNRVNHGTDSDMQAEPGYETHKDDDLGHWYQAFCEIRNWPDQNDVAGFNEYKVRYEAEHPNKYYAATDIQPTPRVSPELLREFAIKSLKLPDPELDWNPKVKAQEDGTLVNFETWFWLNNPPPETLSVRAEALGSWATVTAKFTGMDITAPGEEPTSCDGSGTPYVKGAQTSPCYLVFRWSSASLGTHASGIPGTEKTPVRVTSRWTASWEGTNVGPTPIMLPTQPDTTQPIRVDEVQTVVTSAG